MRKKFFAVALILVGSSAFADMQQCNEGDLILVKQGTVAAINPDHLREATESNSALNQLLQQQVAIKLGKPMRAKVFFAPMGGYICHVNFEGESVPYWIQERTYSKIQ
jgi:hypothetical protein